MQKRSNLFFTTALASMRKLSLATAASAASAAATATAAETTAAPETLEAKVLDPTTLSLGIVRRRAGAAMSIVTRRKAAAGTSSPTAVSATTATAAARGELEFHPANGRTTALGRAGRERGEAVAKGALGRDRLVCQRARRRRRLAHHVRRRVPVLGKGGTKRLVTGDSFRHCRYLEFIEPGSGRTLIPRPGVAFVIAVVVIAVTGGT